ncbi:high affinity immunoglobulin gamma Fc receptor I-like isoform X2 [Perca fluviatilis]|uniref:high affinity immunoglobulin gamma Fc receptor I-like isoform X2 n=1 Tax=Perca fluviatilis TaxID=8168 RepID=UPI0019668CB9|nr:high affinity immunoglobulin gamma Fc receptor I-like isoform X2 [Perca fluviatilis]
MEDTALCIRLLMTVFLQLGAHTQKVDGAFWIIPTRLQLFEYESVSFKCVGFDGLTGWNVLRNIKTEISTCGLSKWGVSNESSCTIKGAFPDDSGEYWCESGGGKRSISVHITVTAGSVILESPAHPVMEGEAVSLSCRNKTSSFNLRADFYKYGRLVSSSSTGEMTLRSVSKSDEGLYMCSISGVGESPESWLSIRVPPETCSSSDDGFLMLRSVLPLVMMAPLLLLLGLLHCGRLGGARRRCAVTESRREDSQKSNEDALQTTVLF